MSPSTFRGLPRSAAVPAMAVGALAVGALAFGALAIGRLAVRTARIRSLEIDELTVHRFDVPERPSGRRQRKDTFMSSDPVADELITIEKMLWTNDGSIYGKTLTDDALLVFAETGVITRDVAIEAIRKENAEGRRWAGVLFDDVRAMPLGSDAALLSYKFAARWAHDNSRSSGHASSVYVRRGDAWKAGIPPANAIRCCRLA